MTQYSLSIKPIQRSKGRSSTAAAAYRAGEEIADERTGEIHDYSKKSDVLHSEVVLPEGGSAVRAEFWNQVEKHHKRGDAVVAREVVLALPSDVPAEHRKELAVSFARELADRYGVGVDVALHDSRTLTEAQLEASPDQHYVQDSWGRIHNENYHAHFLMTGCTVSPDGTLGRKCVALDPISTQRENSRREKEGKELLLNAAQEIRPRWCELANEALEAAGSDVRWDDRSFEAQGIEQAPTKKLGASDAKKERAGIRTKRGNENRSIRELNAAYKHMLSEIKQEQDKHRLWRYLEDFDHGAAALIDAHVIRGQEATPEQLQTDVKRYAERMEKDLTGALRKLDGAQPDFNQIKREELNKRGVGKVHAEIDKGAKLIKEAQAELDRFNELQDGSWLQQAKHYFSSRDAELTSAIQKAQERRESLYKSLRGYLDEHDESIEKVAQNRFETISDAHNERRYQVATQLEDLELYKETHPEIWPEYADDLDIELDGSLEDQQRKLEEQLRTLEQEIPPDPDQPETPTPDPHPPGPKSHGPR